MRVHGFTDSRIVLEQGDADNQRQHGRRRNIRDSAAGYHSRNERYPGCAAPPVLLQSPVAKRGNPSRAAWTRDTPLSRVLPAHASRRIHHDHRLRFSTARYSPAVGEVQLASSLRITSLYSGIAPRMLATYAPRAFPVSAASAAGFP